MTAFSAFYPFIMPDLPGCPDIGIDIELAMVSNHFCKEGWVYRRDTEESVVDGDTEIEPVLPVGSELVGVVSAKDENDRQFYSFTISGDTIVLDKASTTDYTLGLTLALKQPVTATDVPDILFRDHLDTIVAGVKSKLFASPKKSWSDPSLAVYYSKIYMQELSRYTTKAFLDSKPGLVTHGHRFV